MSSFSNDILDAVDILIDGKISKLDFDKTIRASIVELVDASIGQYRVKTQDSIYTAYSTNVNTTYKNGTEVYVQIPSNDFEKDPIIIGSVKKLGVNYISPIDDEDRLVILGANLLQEDTISEIAFCSYNGEQTQEIPVDSAIEQDSLDLYKLQADSMLLAANFKTNLPYEQQVGKGNYGIKLVCSYLDKSYTSPSDTHLIDREYIFDVYDMEGQPYNYFNGSRQKVILDIDAEYLYSIKSITAFCKNFPKKENGKDPDIWISDLELYLTRKLTDEELAGTFLAITSPLGCYFSSKYSERDLKAEIKIQGKTVNTQYQKVNFYWFIKDTSITNGSEYYSDYAGAGWRTLNEVTTVSGGTSIQPAGERITVNKDICPIYTNTFKCVAIFQDKNNPIVLSSVGYLYNKLAQDFHISSSAGTNFAFNMGKTTLTCEHEEESGVTYKYYWAYRADGGNLISLDVYDKSIEIEVGTANQFLEYECTLYANDVYSGAAALTLYNNSNPSGYTLIINNSSLVFKYNGYGVSPTSNSLDEIDRLSIPALTFDIFNEQGQRINLSDTEKRGKCNIKWVWPNEEYTLLTTPLEIVEETYNDPNTNTPIERNVIKNEPQLIYGIKNQYDISRTDNNISLEIDFSGQHLTAITNFTFTKEGELGTNGTKYIARINRKDANVEKVIVRNMHLYGITFVDENHININGSINGAPYKAELWDGGVEPLSLSNYDVAWSIINNRQGTDRNRVNLTIKEKTGILTIMNQLALSSIIQAKITNKTTHKNYFTTIPIDFIIDGDETYIGLITGGYDHCMYETDGTRGLFKTRPFVFKLYDFNTGELVSIPEDGITWSWSWDPYSSIENRNNVTIEPPEVYDSSKYDDNFITCTYNIIDDNNELRHHTVYLSIDFYRNRYGLSAMNDWDGNSIQIKDDNYIIAPQIGAGVKDNNNRFTGITMGKVFYNGSEKIGLFGYGLGEQSIFLDADTGSAIFGKSGAGQIYIDAESGEGTIQSGDYKPSASTEKGTGLKIKFSSENNSSNPGPYIKYGSGDFEVSVDGHLTAKGGGTIASWKIGDTTLKSSNNTISLDSTGNGKIYSNSHNSLTSTNPGFYLSSDGLSIGSSIRISSDNNGSVLVGRLSGSRRWEISGDASNSYIRYGTKGSSGSVYIGTDSISLGNTFEVTNAGVLSSTSGSIGGWTISASDLKSKNGKITLHSDGSITTSSGYFTVDISGNMTAKSGTIGGWVISPDYLATVGKTYGSNVAGGYLGKDGRFEFYKSAGHFIRWNGGDLEIEGGTVKGSQITGGRINIGNDLFEADDDRIDLGNWHITTDDRDALYFGSFNTSIVGFSGHQSGSSEGVLWAGEMTNGQNALFVNAAGLVAMDTATEVHLPDPTKVYLHIDGQDNTTLAEYVTEGGGSGLSDGTWLNGESAAHEDDWWYARYVGDETWYPASGWIKISDGPEGAGSGWYKFDSSGWLIPPYLPYPTKGDGAVATMRKWEG